MSSEFLVDILHVAQFLVVLGILLLCTALVQASVLEGYPLHQLGRLVCHKFLHFDPVTVLYHLPHIVYLFGLNLLTPRRTCRTRTGII
jgi:hypothetical protein